PEPNYEKIITEYKMFHYDKSFIYDYRGILSELDIAMKLGMNRRVMLSLFKLDYQKVIMLRAMKKIFILYGGGTSLMLWFNWTIIKLIHQIEINMQPDFPFDMVHAQFLLLELINCMPVLVIDRWDAKISNHGDISSIDHNNNSICHVSSDGDDNSNISQQSALKQYLASSSSSASKQQCISSLSTSKGNFEIEDLVQGLSNVKVHHH
ncbi:9492_t:CDS:2, partial [Entrophospora sp. SA101]